MSITSDTIYERAGGKPAFVALTAALHARCLMDEYLNHPFSHIGNSDHLENLSNYLIEVFGGPSNFSKDGRNQATMLSLHAGHGVPDEWGTHFVKCFMQAVDDVPLPDDLQLRSALRDYIEWAMQDVQVYAPVGADVPIGLPMPKWSWNGLQ